MKISAANQMNSKTNSFLLIVISALVLVYAALLAGCVGSPKTLTLDDLERVCMGFSYAKVTGEIGNGKWLHDAESFTVAYEVEGGRVLLLVFDDGVYLSEATLYESAKAMEMGYRITSRNMTPTLVVSLDVP